ncbi:TlyA family RNA methyltransferase [Candidatus Poriferisocius sp.]|uniref:TlyA family RNA methyltransferase n=1 Tax=Candidatus Poriferisocius sp. TaxID=3101276 RepID=UPI003B01E8A1
MKASRRRLDVELIRRGLVASRDRAREAVASGRVTVNGAVAQKAARLVLPGDAVEVSGPPNRHVSRGGEKLEGALAAFNLDVVGMRCCDVGASTGGFTDCLLQNGAAGVVAVDVGRAQMHERLTGDSRVTVYERTDVREVEPVAIGSPFDLVTADVSFISLTSVMTSLAELAAPSAPVVVLVKPQFEVGRLEASRGRGVIRDPELWQAALDRATESAILAGLAPQAAIPSPLKGAQGNVEFFLHLKKGGVPSTVDSAQLAAEVVTNGG